MERRDFLEVFKLVLIVAAAVVAEKFSRCHLALKFYFCLVHPLIKRSAFRFFMDMTMRKKVTSSWLYLKRNIVAWIRLLDAERSR